MSYEPSHRKPPRQERWPNATPAEGWPAYQQGDSGRTWEPAEAFAGSSNGYGTASNGYGTASNGYGTASNGYGTASNGYGTASNGYADAWGGGSPGSGGYGNVWGGRGPEAGGYGDARGGRGPGAGGYGGAWDGARYGDPGQGYWTNGNGHGGTTTAYPAAGDGYVGDGHADYYEAADGWDGYPEPGHEFTGSAGYLAQDSYPALEPGASAVLVAPDTDGEWWRRPDRGGAGGQDHDRGLVVGAVTGLLAAAVAIGVATLAAAFVRPQASPVTAVGGVLVGRLPASVRTHLMAHLGAHAQTVLLLGAVGLIAVVLGGLAGRNPSAGVAGLAAFGLLGAFVAITRPESRDSDVIPAVIGALAGIAALLWLIRASAPAPRAAAPGPAYRGGRRAR